ncbi:esterase [Rhodococcus qingshengii]|nr:esterase [Rhodococcus qingshengii]
MWILERMHGHQLLTRLSRMSLEHGHITAVLLVGSVIVGVGTLLLLRWLPRRAALVALGLSVLGSATGAMFVWLSFRPLPAQLPASNFVWIALAMFGVIGAALVLLRRPGLARGLSVTAFAGLAAIVAVGQVNAQTGTYPTLGSLVGHWPVGSVENVAFDSLPGAEPWVQRGLPTETHWQVPVRMPSNGVVTEAAIPGNVSGFDARPATLYLPPAYLADPRAELPVLVLVAGEPGSPSDWLDSGRLATTVDAYASRHSGLAPVVVVPDALGDYDANPGCMDSALGNVATYLDQDVPNWIESNLQVNPDAAQWAIGGFSYGGTCAIEMAVNFPDRYPSFLDFSGQDEPSTGDHEDTVAAMFDGDESAFDAVNARDLMAQNRYPQLSGVFVAGEDDDIYRPQQEIMFEAARAADMNVDYYTLPGGHSGDVWGTALELEMDWLGRTLALTP